MKYITCPIDKYNTKLFNTIKKIHANIFCRNGNHNFIFLSFKYIVSVDCYKFAFTLYFLLYCKYDSFICVHIHKYIFVSSFFLYDCFFFLIIFLLALWFYIIVYFFKY